MESLVSLQQKADFERDGIVKLRSVIDENLLAKLNQCFEWAVANPGPLAYGSPNGEDITFIDNANPKGYQMYGDLVLESNFGAIASELWGSEYVGFFAEQVFLKQGKSKRTDWHQDTVYWPLGGEHWANFWIPLVEMTEEQSVQVVRGSHKSIMYDPTLNPNDPSTLLWGEAGNFPRLPDITADLAKDPSSWDIVGFDVSPGDLVILHPHSIHAGGANDDTLAVRRNLVLHFCGDKSYYSDHLPHTPGIFEHKPLGVNGRFLQAGDLYRPASMIRVNPQ